MSRLTKTYDLYEVVKVPFPFTDIHSTKVRPAIVISAQKFNAGIGSSILSMITSLKPSKELWPSDIEIEDLTSAGLPVPSIIRLKIFTLDHRLILLRLGHLSKTDQSQLQKKLRDVLSI